MTSVCRGDDRWHPGAWLEGLRGKEIVDEILAQVTASYDYVFYASETCFCSRLRGRLRAVDRQLQRSAEDRAEPRNLLRQRPIRQRRRLPEMLHGDQVAGDGPRP